MHISTPTEARSFRFQTCKSTICFCWIVGLLFGMLAAVVAGDSVFLMMRSAECSAVSIPGLLILVLPFLFTAFAVYVSLPWLLYLIVLFKAFTFGFSVCGTTAVFSQVAWLVRFLLFFGDVSSLPILMWLWLGQGSKPNDRFLGEICACSAVALLLGIFDVYIVSPFWTMLM